MIPRFNIKRIKNRLEGNTRWMDYLPPILNFAPPRYFSQADLVFDESDRSFLKKFDAESPVYEDYDGNLYAANALEFKSGTTTLTGPIQQSNVFYLSKRELNPLRFNIYEPDIVTRLTPLGEVLAKSVGMILPDFDWQQIIEPTSLSEEFFDLEDIVLLSGHYRVGMINEAMAFSPEDEDEAEVYQFNLDGDDEGYYYTLFAGSEYLTLLDANDINLQIFDDSEEYEALIDLDGDPEHISGIDFIPNEGLYVYFSQSIGAPFDWTYDDDDDKDVLIDLNDLISIRKQLFDKAKSDGIYIADQDVYNFVFSGAVDKNQLTLFGDLDG